MGCCLSGGGGGEVRYKVHPVAMRKLEKLVEDYLEILAGYHWGAMTRITVSFLSGHGHKHEFR